MPRKEKLVGKATIDLTVDKALKAKWVELEKVIARAKSEGASSFDDLWEATADIVENEPPLYLAAGLSTAKAFFEEYLASDERTARRMMRVAKYASPDEENKYGVSKIDAALDYLEAKAGPGQKGRLPVDFGKLRIPTYEKDGPRSVLLADATVEQVRGATRALRKPGAMAKEHPFARAIAQALNRGPLRTISVRVAAGKVSLGAIPLGALPALAAALAKVQLPAVAAPKERRPR